MSDERSLQAAMWIMVVIQTIGSVDLPGTGPRKMPPPRVYVPVIVSYGILNLIADAGSGRTAKALGWIIVVAATVLGPFGVRLVNFMNGVAQNFGGPPVNYSPTSPPGQIIGGTGGGTFK